MLKYFRFFLIVFVVIFLTNCHYPIKPYEFIPVYDQYTDDQGLKIGYSEEDNIYIEVNYEYHSINEITFFVYIKNLSLKAIEVDPKKFILRYGYEANSAFQYIPIDSKKELDFIQNEYINLSLELIHKTYKNLENLFTTIGYIINKDSTMVGERVKYFVTEQNNAYQSFFKINNELEDDEYFWSNHVLKRTILKPNEDTSGLLIFNNFDNNRIRITIELNGKYYYFYFKRNFLEHNKNANDN